MVQSWSGVVVDDRNRVTNLYGGRSAVEGEGAPRTKKKKGNRLGTAKRGLSATPPDPAEVGKE